MSMDKQLQFFVSARDGDLPKVKALLQDGVPIDGENAGGATALEMASYAGQLHVVEFLIANGARIDPAEMPCFSSALIAAVTYHHTAVVALLLQKGADANAVDGKGQTALIWAAFHGAPIEIIDALITNGANAKHKDATGHNAHDYALEAGHRAIANHLARQGT